MSTQLCLIAAFGNQGQVGLNGDLPWHIPSELKHFKETTKNCPIIMGRNTFESIGHPLPGRRNIILSTKLPLVPGAEIAANLEEAIRMVSDSDRAFIIGGPRVWEEALPLVSQLILSEISYDDEADTYLSEGFFEKVRKNFKLDYIRAKESFTVSYWSDKSLKTKVF